MLYLSQLTLNPRLRPVQRDVTDVYQLHRTVMSGFPATLPAGERVLFRLEQHARLPYLMLLVQSHTEPDWSDLAASGRLLPPDPFDLSRNPAVKPFNLALRAGQQLYFRLRANPTVKRDGERHALFREELYLDWLRRKAEQSGFRLLSVRSSSEEYLSGLQRGGHESRRLKLFAVQFDGLLQVTDAGRVQEAVAAGIGPARAFGCGLLSLAPA